MKVGALPRLLGFVASVFLIGTGANEWSSTSSGAGSWENETSFMALQLRAQGKLKVGLGLGFLALTSIGADFSPAAVRGGHAKVTGEDTPRS